MTYLYLLPFKDGVHFKLGISKSLDDRISNHVNNFDLDPDKALCVTAKHSAFIISLEQELLLLLDNPKYPEYVDGHTEIRLMNDFEKVLSYINSKSDFLGFKVDKYNIKIKPKRKKEAINKTIIKTEKTYLNPIERLRKELDISQIKISDHLGIKQYAYNRMENSTCDDETRNKFLQFFISECNNLDISKKRLSDLLGIHRSNIYKYKGDTEKVLESERAKRMQLKMELYNMLK